MQSKATILCAILALALVLPPLIGQMWKAGGPMDEGMVLAYPERILHGALPYRDFETLYAPGNLYFLAGVYSLFGVDLTVSRVVGLIYRLAFFAGLFCVGMRFGPGTALGMTLFAMAITICGMSGALAWWGALGCAVWAIYLLGCSRILSGGVLMCAALWFRHDLILGLLPACLLFFMGFTVFQRRRLLLVVGCSAVLLIWLVSAVGWQALWGNLVISPALTAPYRKLPVLNAPPDLLGMLIYHLAACLLAGWAGWLLWKKQNAGGKRDGTLLALALLAAGTSHQAFYRFDFPHAVYVCALSSALLIPAFHVLAREYFPKLSLFVRHSFAFGSAILLLLLLCRPAITVFSRNLPMYFGRQVVDTATVEHNGRSFPMSPLGKTKVFQETVNFLANATRPGERFFAGSKDLSRAFCNDTCLYYLLPQLEPASYFMELNPGSATRPGSRLAKDVRSADWLLLNAAYDSLFEPNLSRFPGPDDANRVVRESFEMVKKIGPLEIYRRRENAGSSAN